MDSREVVSLEKIIDISKVQKIQDDFASATGVTSVIVDTKGKLITKPSNFRNLCIKLATETKKGDIIGCQDCNFKGVRKGKRHICQVGLKEFSYPIRLNGKKVATLLVGGIFLEKPKKEKIEEIIQKTGISKKDIDEIPVVSKEQVETISKLLSITINRIFELAYQTMHYEHEIKMLTLLEKIGEAINSVTQVNDVLNVIFERAKEVIDYDTLCILLLDESTKKLKAKAAYGVGKEILETAEFGPDEGYAGWVLKNRKPFITGDVRKAEVKIKYEELNSKFGLNSFILVPLIKEKGEMIGTFIFGSKRKDAFTENDIKIGTTIANQATITISKAKLYEELNTIVNIATILDLRELLNAVVKEAAKLVNGYNCSIFLLDDTSGNFVLRASDGLPQEYIGEAFYKPGEGFTGWVGKYGQPLRISNAQDPEELKKYPDLKWAGKYIETEFESKSFLAVPLKTRDGKVVGIIRVPQKREGEFTTEDERLLSAFANQIALAYENAKLFETVQEISKERESHFKKLRHQLLSPLGGVRQFANFLSEGVSDKERKEEFYQTLYQEAARFYGFIENLFVSFDIENKNLKIHPEKIDLKERVENALSFLKPQIEKRNIIIKDELSEEEKIIGADKNLLHHIFLNILSNAIKYTDKEKGQITVHLHKVNGEILIDFIDNGIGINEAHLEDIFKPGYREEDKKSIPGIGLGLSIVKEIIEKFGWKIEVESKEGVGSKFTIKLPVGGILVSIKNILVVDDEEKWFEIVQYVLEEKGKNYSVFYAKNEDELLKVIEKIKIDLIILDIIFGDQVDDGFEICRRLKQNPQTKDIPVVMYTIRDDALQRSLEVGAIGCIEKEINENGLLNRIERILKKDLRYNF